VYQWPTPFRATEWGLYDEEGRRLPVASRVQFVVVPAVLSGTSAAVFASISAQFRFVAGGGGVSVYERGGPAGGQG
jgi:hypothetical protein